ncbi:Importin-beta [Gracilaria domingensis]|nr:Importin-beta [Gracilaria domingensis]
MSVAVDTPGNGYAAIPNDLAGVERMCEQLYTAQDATIRQQAESALLSLASNPRHLSQCTMILENSAAPYAQKFAAWTLTKLITSYWSQIGVQERVELRNYVLNYMANKGPQLEQYVRLELTTLLCRVTKLGWNDGDSHRGTVDDVCRFLDASEEHCIIGLQILARLVSDMNTSATTFRRTITHSQARKVSLSFRDLQLLKVFNIAINTFAKLSPPPQHAKLRSCALELSRACLSYDFIGTSLDESSEDIGTLHPPTTWHVIVEDPSTVKVFMDTYRALCNSDSTQSSKALECLIQLVSMRRTLFTKEELRVLNIQRHMAATLEILSNRMGLDDHNNYHQFCRWLARLKVNYQLDEIANVDIYPQWIELVSSFTVQSLAADWNWVGDSLYYVLSLWAKLIAAKPYLKSGVDTRLDVHVVKIIEQYISRRLVSIRQADDDDEDDFSEHLDAIPMIFRLQYEKSAVFLTSLMDPMLENYKAFAASGGVGANPHEVSRLERELAWLVRIIGAVVGGKANSLSSEQQELTEGELSARVFQLMIHTVNADNVARNRPGVTPSALATPSGRARNTKGAIVLDAAIADFTQAFRRSYIGEEAVANSKVYVKMAERLGMTDHMHVLDVVASKIACNLRNYGVVDGLQIIGKSLSLLQDLASGYSSGRVLCKLQTIRDMIQSHDEESFPFMKGPDAHMGRHRTTFYQTLLRILFASPSTSADPEREFTQFMEPLQRKLEVLATLPSKEAFLNDQSVKAATIGVLRDLRGVAATVANRKTYTLFFDWLYPTHTPVLLKICSVFSEAGVPEVTNVVLKFFTELVFNKSQRIVFDSSSPNGILLFREASKVLETYGKYTLANWERIGGTAMVKKNNSVDAYRVLYKGTWVCLLMFQRALSGGYVNFGVFALYGDPALKNAMAICFQLILAVPIDQLLAYPKVARAHFGLLEILAASHPKDIAQLDHVTFSRILESLREGLQSYEVWMSSQSASAIDALSAFRFKQAMKGSDYGRMMQAHVDQSPELFPSCLEIIFTMIINIDCTNQWSLSRPLLSLILTNQDTYVKIKNRVIQSQPPERQSGVASAFDKLMFDVQMNLESKNRDRFTQQVTQFRLALREVGVTDGLVLGS